MSNPIATPDDLAAVLGSDVDYNRAETLIDLATDLCASIIDPLPDAARAVVIGVAVRAYSNPQSVQSETVGPYSANYGPTAGGLYLTKRDKATLLRISGRGGAFTIDPTPANAGQGLPTWDQNITWLSEDPDSILGGDLLSYTPNGVTPNQYAQLKGQTITSIQQVSANTTITGGTEAEVTTGTSTITITLTTPTSAPAMFVAKKMDGGSGVVNVVDSTGKLIDGAASFTINMQYASFNFLWDGTQYAVN